HGKRRRSVKSRAQGDGAGETATAAAVQAAVEAMRAREIKKELESLGISTRGVFDKDQLVSLLLAHRLSAPPSAPSPQSSSSSSSSNSRTAEASPPPSRSSSPSPSSPSSSSQGVILRMPMRRLATTAREPREYVILPLEVAGKGPFDFLLDTGSSTTLVSPDFAYGTIGLSTNEGRMTQGLGGMGPEGKQGRELLLPDVRLGEFRFGPMQAVVLDLQYTGLPGSVAGIVGLSFLSAFDMDFDFPSSTLTVMHSGAALAAAGKWTAGGTIPPPPYSSASQGLDFEGLAMLAPATVPFNLPAIQISVNGKHLETAILDMGSGLSLITTAVASRAGVTPSRI
ncbi:unnamed protein product, partial [Closterium sp. NIES-53]